VRQLASDLDLAPNTVARAYRELEQDGLLVTRGRRGTFVAGPLPPPPSDAAAGRPNVAQLDARRLDAAAEVFDAQARRLGVDRRSAILAVNQALAALPADRTR
jgi:DNA-binding transcriptional regulator YhcF (GntR family)